MKRDWTDAHSKVRAAGECRACRRRGRVEAAHTVGRRYDRVEVGDHLTDVVYVDPDDVVPLCPGCHRAYDAHQLDILPVLTYAEQAAAVRHVGLVRAMARLTSGQGGDNAATLG